MKYLSKWLFSLLGGMLLLSQTALAERSEQFGDYVVHYNALTTDILEPRVAQQYGIKRSKNRAMLNISILKMSPDRPLGQAVTAEISAMGSTLTGVQRVFDLREVHEGEAIYYIGDFPIAHRDALNFEIKVSPRGGSQTYTVSFKQEFFTD